MILASQETSRGDRRRVARLFALRLTLCLTLALAGRVLAQSPRPEGGGSTGAQAVAATFEPAPLVVWNRPIAVFRAPYEALSPAERARSAQRRIEGLPLDLLLEDIEVLETTLGDQHGILVIGGNTTLFGLLDDDLDRLSGETLASAGEDARRQLRAVFDARLEQRRPATVMLAIGVAALALLVVWLVFMVVGRGRRALARRLERVAPSLTERTVGVDLRPALFSTGRLLLDAAAWTVRILAVYLALSVVLRQLPYTRPWGDRLGAYFTSLLLDLGTQLVRALPGLLTALVIFVIARLVSRTVDGLLRSAEDESITVSWLHPTTVPATRRIIKVVIWLLALTAAYPYLPGSGTAAFKGVSVFAGAMLTLGSSGLVTQLMSGLVLIYSRALKPGDLVQIGETLGVVTEVGILSTKLRTPRGEQVTMPNAVVISNQVTNLTAEALLSTSVTIGYDAPWRQVHALLLLAAQRTSGVRAEPPPYVVQRALSDFYVEYELRAQPDRPMERMSILSELHTQIQDAFNEFGVQIMVPHFEGQPDRPVVVAPDAWHATPAPKAVEVAATAAEGDQRSA